MSPRTPGLGRVPSQYDANAVRFLTALKETVEAYGRAQQDIQASLAKLVQASSKTSGASTLTADNLLALLRGRITPDQLTDDLAARIGTDVENEDSLKDTAEDVEDTADDLQAQINDKQDADDLLTAIANLVTSADKIIYTTGADTVALATLSAFMRAMLSAADAAGVATGLGGTATGINAFCDDGVWRPLGSGSISSPTPPTSFNVTANSDGTVTLAWINPTFDYFDHCEIRASTTNDVATATSIYTGSSSPQTISRTIGSWYFWIRSYDAVGYFSVPWVASGAVQVDNAPAFVSSSVSISVVQDTTIDLLSYLSVDDPDTGQTLTWSQSSAPSHGTLTLTGTTHSSGGTGLTPDGTATYAPTSGYVGSDSFSVQVSDGFQSAVKTFSITLTANTAPTFVGGSTTLSLAGDTANDLKPNLHVSDTDAGQTLTWSQSSAPSHGTLTFTGATASSGSADITPGGTITYTPTTGYAGSDSFAVQVSDGITTATRAFTVTVVASDTHFANVVLLLPLESDLNDVIGHSSTRTGSSAPTLASTSGLNYGGYMAQCDSGKYLSYADSDDWHITSSGYGTLEFWLIPTSSDLDSSIHPVWNQFDPPNSSGFIFGTENGKLYLWRSGNPVFTSVTSGNVALTAGTLYYVALVYDAGAATDKIRLYLNGSLICTKSTQDGINNVAAAMNIGGDSSFLGRKFYGKVKDLRATKGVARYSGSTMAVPTSPHPTA